MSYFANGYRKLKRIIAWFPVLWKDEDWHYAYLFEIIRFKISRMRTSIDANKIHIGYEKHVDQMKIAEELLARMAFSNFYDELFDRLRSIEKIGNCSCPEETFSIEHKSHDYEKSETGFSYFVDLSCEYCKNAWRRWIATEEKKKHADFEFLFRHLEKNIKKWWD